MTTRGLLNRSLCVLLLVPAGAARSEGPACLPEVEGDAWDTCVAYCDTVNCDVDGPADLCSEILATYLDERSGLMPPCAP
jgi:hypothetical protein